MIVTAPGYQSIRIVLSPRAPRKVSRQHHQEAGTWLTPLLASAAGTVLLLVKSRHGSTPFQAAMAFALVAIPCFAYADWRRTRRSQIPLFAVLAAAHTVFYCCSIFWTDLLDEPAGKTATAVLGMALSGVCGLFIGMRLGASQLVVRRVNLPDVPSDTHNWWLIRAIAGCQAIVPFLPVGSGGDFRQLIAIALSFIPLVAFLILWDATLRGKATSIDKVLVVVFLAASVVGGLASGWLGSCVGTFVLASIAFVRVRRRIPVIPLAGIVLAMLFLQGGKSAFRERYWYGTDGAGPVEKARFWIEKSAERLMAFTVQPGGDAFRDSFEEPLLTRSSLVTEAATVYERTPSAVSYQYGATYEYLLITLIPRFLWPDKPSVNDSNRLYQLSYGVTQQEDLDHVAIGAGLIPEAYMNFGWIGIPLVMCLAGVILGVFERIFLGQHAGTFASAVGLAYVLQLLSLNGQAAAYFGGMIQIIGLTMVIFLPGLRFQVRSSPARLQWRARPRSEVLA
jgi:TM2 domain-containing membrane protein YozV